MIIRGEKPTTENFLLLKEKINFNIDNAFLEYMKESNGAEGFITQELYLQIWKIEDILEMNPYYEDVPICQDLLFFGSNGGDTGFAFDKKTGYIVCISWLDIGEIDPSLVSYKWLDFLGKVN